MTNRNLRERAEELLQANPRAKPQMNTTDVQDLVHELQLHQAELEMQNEELQETQQRLTESRDAYAELYDFAPVGYLTLDQHDMITEANHTAANMLGTERGNLVRCRFGVLVHADVQTQWFQHRRALRSSGEKQVIELELQKADGTPLTARLDCRPEGDSDTGDWRCLIALSDITEKTRAVKALQETYDELQEREQKFEQIFHNANDAMYLHQLTDDNQLGYFLEVNRTACEMLGYSREEFLQMGPPDIDSEKTKEELPPVISDLLRKGEKTFERTHVTKSGAEVPVEISAHVFHAGKDRLVLSVARDITERKHRERYIEHINSLLGAIRNVNQAIVEGTEVNVVMEKACQALLDARSYQTCAIALLNDDGKILSSVVQAGKMVFSDTWTITQEGEGNAPECVKAAVRAKSILLRCPPTDCGNCPYKDEGMTTATVPMITADGRIVGILNVLMGDTTEMSGQEQFLLQEVSQDLAFAREKILAEQKVRDSNAELNAIVQNAPYVMLVVDANRRVRQINSAGATLAGDKPDNLHGLSTGEALRCIHAQDDPEGCGFGTACQDCPLRNTVLDTLDNQRCHSNVETNMTFHKDGGEEHLSLLVNTAPFDIGGERMALVVFADVTEMKKAELNLRDLQKFWQSTLDSLTSHVAVVDENADIIAVNESWCRFADENGLGWTDYGVGRNYLQYAEGAASDSVEGADEAAKGIRQLFNEQWNTFELEYPCHGPDQERWFRMQGTRFHDSHGVRIVLAHENITQRKQAELELERALADLKDAQKSLVDQERQRAFTTMASGIAHDFNNALSPILGFSKMIVDNPKLLDDRDKTLRYLNHIQKSATHAAETVQRMRKFYRPGEEETFAEIDLNAVVTDAVSLTQPRWKEEAAANGMDIDVQTELEELPPVRGNEAALNEVLTNLIFNAVDAISDGGVIRIATKQSGGSVVLEVNDTGGGMSEETKDRCFDPFYTTKDTGGSGLGLATITGIIQRHDGDMTVESAEGQGTTFRITLPPVQSRAEAETQKESRQNRTLQILVAEDEESQREMLSDLLGDEGHGVVAAADAADALAYFNAGAYDLVITDRAMPGMSGDEFAKCVKEKVPGKPVIMITGFGDMMDAADGKPENVDVLVSKPLTAEKLQEAITEVTE